MTTASFEHRKYAPENIDTIRIDIERDGWTPMLAHDPPGRRYPVHEHATDKLLVFLSGHMVVEAGGNQFRCQPGDCLEIPGSMVHAAEVGDQGCIYLWSEQVRERVQ